MATLCAPYDSHHWLVDLKDFVKLVRVLNALIPTLGAEALARPFWPHSTPSGLKTFNKSLRVLVISKFVAFPIAWVESFAEASTAKTSPFKNRLVSRLSGRTC